MRSRDQDLFVVNRHQEVLAAWAKIRLDLGFPPHLVSFDSHTDSHRAFLRHLRLASDSTELVERGEPLVQQIRIDDAGSILTAINLLASDEHIDCARRARIIDRVFIGMECLTCFNKILIQIHN